jgi:hypothetical protein
MAKPITSSAPSTTTTTNSAAPKATTPDPIDPIEPAVPAVEPQAEVAPEAKPAAAKGKDVRSPVSIVLSEHLQKRLRLLCAVEGIGMSRFCETAIEVALKGRMKAALASLSDELE